MAKLSIKAGATSETVEVFIQDSSSSTGAGLTGLVYNTSSLVCYYSRPRAAATAVTLATLAAATSAWSSGGFKEIDATNMPGVYRLDVPDAAIATGVRCVTIILKGAANMAPCVLEIELTAVDNQSATAFVTAVNGLAPPTNWNLHSIDSNGRVDVIKLAGTSQTARDIGASVLLSAGTGTGQLDFTSGVVKSNLVQILGTALTETAGQIAAAFKKFFNIATPAATMDHLILVDTVTTYTGNTPQTGDSYARLGAPAGASHAADTAAVKTDTAAVKTQTDKLTFTVANQVDSNVLDWKSATAPAMTGDAFARLGAPAGASVSADVAAAKVDTAAIKTKTDQFVFTVANKVDAQVRGMDADVLTSSALAASAVTEIAGGVKDVVIEGSMTLADFLKVIGAVEAGVTEGAGTTTVKFKKLSNSASDAIVATLETPGSPGDPVNRTGITITV